MYILYIIIYIYGNVLNYILFEFILTNRFCMFYVPISISMIVERVKLTIIIIIKVNSGGITVHMYFHVGV